MPEFTDLCSYFYCLDHMPPQNQSSLDIAHKRCYSGTLHSLTVLWTYGKPCWFQRNWQVCVQMEARNTSTTRSYLASCCLLGTAEDTDFDHQTPLGSSNLSPQGVTSSPYTHYSV